MAAFMSESLRDLDQRDVFEDIERKVETYNNFNLAVMFSRGHASAASNLNARELQAFLAADTQSQGAVKWIHISGPDYWQECIDTIADRYRLSSRLKAIIKSPNVLAARSSPVPTASKRSNSKEGSGSDAEVEDHQIGGPDLEKAISRHRETKAHDEFNHYRIVSRVWHFWSIDWTERCLCIGYNSLSNLAVKPPNDGKPTASSRRERLRRSIEPTSRGQPSPEPDVTRLWNWLLICDDGTVISIQESYDSAQLEAELKGKLSQLPELLKNSRRTLSNVLRNMSKEGVQKATAIDALDIRPECSRDAQSSVTISDSPGLLFYYLFDDWYTTFSLVADDNSRYTTVLNKLVREPLSTLTIY